MPCLFAKNELEQKLPPPQNGAYKRQVNKCEGNSLWFNLPDAYRRHLSEGVTFARMHFLVFCAGVVRARPSAPPSALLIGISASWPSSLGWSHLHLIQHPSSGGIVRLENCMCASGYCAHQRRVRNEQISISNAFVFMRKNNAFKGRCFLQNYLKKCAGEIMPG